MTARSVSTAPLSISQRLAAGLALLFIGLTLPAMPLAFPATDYA